MTNTSELIDEAMRTSRSLRRYEGHPTKAKKHRYERRKVRFFIRLGDWNEDDSI
jgi:hypothetical protein